MIDVHIKLCKMAAETPTEEAGVGSILDHFSEVDEVRSLISTLPSIYNELRPCEAGLERWTGMCLAALRSH